jgi:signal transduction histidine kinase
VFEALSNVLQHARAHTLTIQARVEGDVQTVRVIDDGHGFDVHTVQSRGMASMRERAAAIGASLQVSSGVEGTIVEITLP